MDDITINPATPEQIPLLHEALTRLSAELDDPHPATAEMLMAEGFGPDPAYHALLAMQGEALAGALLCSTIFSTNKGGRGLYVADLWVAAPARGRELGQRLLGRAARLWDARFIRLAVYTDNPDARRFYDRIGFKPESHEVAMTIQGDALSRLTGRAD